MYNLLLRSMITFLVYSPLFATVTHCRAYVFLLAVVTSAFLVLADFFLGALALGLGSFLRVVCCPSRTVRILLYATSVSMIARSKLFLAAILLDRLSSIIDSFLDIASNCRCKVSFSPSSAKIIFCNSQRLFFMSSRDCMSL